VEEVGREEWEGVGLVRVLGEDGCGGVGVGGGGPWRVF
jgi:hypothetical protein